MSGDAGGGYSFVWVCDGIDLLYDYYCVNTIGTQYIFDKVLKRKFLHFNWGTDDDSVGYYEEGFSNYSPIRGSNYGYNGNLVTILVKP